MYHVEAFIAGERWEQQGATYESPAAASEAALAISRERQVCTRVFDEIMGWTRFECLPGGIQLRAAYDRAMPEIYRIMRAWAYPKLPAMSGREIDMLMEGILHHITRELQEHP